MGLFGPPKEKKRKLTIDELELEVKQTQQATATFTQSTVEKFQEIQKAINNLSENMNSLKETKNIPQEWVSVISTMREIDPTLPDMSVIYSVLIAHKNLSQNLAKAAQERTIQKLAMKKTEIVARKIHNCVKCGNAVEEGEYYLFGGKPYCLSHKDEPLREQGVQEDSL